MRGHGSGEDAPEEAARHARTDEPADGILRVQAKELGTGVEQEIQVKPTYGLGEEEVERMLVESIEHAEEDVTERFLSEWRIEGDYWRFSQDINQSGDFWIGSLDRRYSWRQQPGETPDSWGEEAAGTLTSPECTLRARYLSFRLGGSAHGSQRIEVHVKGARVREYFRVRLFGGPGDPSFGGAMGYPTQYNSPSAPQEFPPPTGSGGWTVVRSAMPDERLDSDWMQVFTFDLKPFVGERMLIRIVDDHRDQCAALIGDRCAAKKPEHLQPDEFRFADRPPLGIEWLRHSDGRCGGVPEAGDGCSPIGLIRSKPPLWGITDVHGSGAGVWRRGQICVPW